MSHKRDAPVRPDRDTATKKAADDVCKRTTWQQLVHSTTVHTLRTAAGERKELIMLSHRDTLATTLSTLSRNRILSCPVFDRSVNPPVLMGLVDVLDVAGYVLSNWEASPSETDFFSYPVIDVVNFSGCDSTVCIDDKASVSELLDHFLSVRYRRRLRRVVVTQAGEPVGIVSQSDVVRWAHRNAHALDPKFLQCSVAGAQLGHPPVVVRVDEPLCDVLRLLVCNRFSGIALVDESYHLSAHLSASNLRGMHASLKYFSGSTLQFLSKGTEEHGRIDVSALTLGPEDTVKALMDKMCTQRLHRMLIVDEANRPKAIVSMIDVIAQLR